MDTTVESHAAPETKTIQELVDFTMSEFAGRELTPENVRGMLNHAVRNARSGHVIQEQYPASAESVAYVLAQPVGDEGRSEFAWIITARGDTALGVWPTGELGFFGSEVSRGQDYEKAVADGTVRYDLADEFTGWLD